MKRLRTSLWLLLVLVTLSSAVSSCGTDVSQPVLPTGGSTDLEPGADEIKVVVLVIDGPRYTETFGDSTHQHVPHIWNQLAPQGTLFLNFRNVGWTATVPGHASLLTGTWQLLNNEGLERPHAPTIFEYFRAHTGADSTAAVLVGGKPKLAACTYSNHVDYGASFGATEDVGHPSDVAVYERLVSVLANDKPRLVMAGFSITELMAHSGVWEDYVAQIRVADSLALVTWNTLQNDPYYAGQTYMFITSDHGRHDDLHGSFQHHGDSCEGCQRLTLLALGPGVRQNYTVPLQMPFTQRDLCPTVGQILGVPTPLSDGRVIQDMFEPVTTGIR